MFVTHRSRLQAMSCSFGRRLHQTLGASPPRIAMLLYEVRGLPRQAHETEPVTAAAERYYTGYGRIEYECNVARFLQFYRKDIY